MGVTHTTRAGAPKVDGNESFEDSVVYIAQALDVLDSEVGWKQVTSGTRPPSPFPGETIFETDTRRYFVYDSSISDWFKVGGPDSQISDISSFTSGIVSQTAGVYTLGWSVVNQVIPYAGMLKVDVSTAFIGSGNTAGSWRLVLSQIGTITPVSGLASRRFSNGGLASVMPGGHIHYETPVAKGNNLRVGVEFTVDATGANVNIHPGGSNARVYI